MAETVKLEHLTWGDFLARALDDPKLDKAASRRRGDSDWAGATWDGAVAMATGAGYSAVLPEVERIVSRIDDTVAAHSMQTTFESTWQVSGAEVDMGRYLSGEPECMIESLPVRISRQGRAVRVVVPVGVVHTVKPEIIMRRGAAVMALADILSRAQHPLEVVAGHACHSTSRDKRLCYMVTVQEANEPLDPGRLMYALAHPSMLRRLLFSVMEHEAGTLRKAFGVPIGGYGYGPYRNVASDLPEDSGTTIILPELGSGSQWTEAESVAWIESQLAKILDND